MTQPLLLVFLTMLGLAQASIHSNPFIKTTSGILIGQTVTLDNNAQVHRFLGVPYAQAPTGSNRFEKPQLIGNQSDTILLAQQVKPTCVQMRHLSKAISPLLDVDQDHNVSEDCLYLNIYAPANSEQSNLPIMVWLPGEGFDFADARQYNGAYLASLGQVIVITVQYRVGVFGFLKNNAGLWDQLLALQWIQENARGLGGNAENVTLFGRFTGSMSISILLSSPQVIQSASSLFNRAILMSGIAVGNWVFDSQPDDKMRQVFQDTDCASLSCLKSLPAEQLLAKSGYGWKPFLDSELIVEQPLVALSKGHFPKYVSSVMLGTNQFEGNLCLLKHLVVDLPFYNKLIHDNVSTSEYATAIHQDLAMFYGKEGAQSSDSAHRGLVQDRAMYVQFCSELLIDSHMRKYNEFLHKISNNASFGLVNVFNYKLDYKPSFSIAPAFINSSIHGDDVILAFGLAFKNNSQISPNDQEISSLMVSLFSSFAQTGAPFKTSTPKSVQIQLQSDSELQCPFTTGQLLVALIGCVLLFSLLCLVKLAAQLRTHRPTEHIKQLIQNHSEIY